MKELIEFIARSLTSNPDAVRVTKSDEGDQIVIRLEVAPEDKGKVIGRQGRVAQAMRTLLRVAAVKDGHPRRAGDCLNAAAMDAGVVRQRPRQAVRIRRPPRKPRPEW